MALIGEMQYLTIGGNTYSLPSGGGGSVTSVAVSNATNGGLSISGSPISSSGTITIGHSNVLAAAQTTQAVYPIKIDKNGHISAYGSAVTISDTKNTAGSTDSNSKLFLIGATSQAANPQTYSHDTAYVGTDGYLYSNSKKTLVEQYSNNGYNLNITPSVSSSSVDFTIQAALDNSGNFYETLYFGSDGFYISNDFDEKTWIHIDNSGTTPVSITGIKTPQEQYDAANKKYVDDSINALDGSITGTAGAGKTLTAFSQTNGKVTATFGNISITKSQISDFPTIPDVSGKIDTAGTGLSKSGTTLNHSNSITAQTTQAVYPIKIDAQGHISAYGSAVTIPTVNNATLTIQKNGTTVNSFTANASSNVTANITVPTKTSDLTNDSGFITTETDPVFSASAAAGITSTDITSWNGKLDTSYTGSSNTLTAIYTSSNGGMLNFVGTNSAGTEGTAINLTQDFRLFSSGAINKSIEFQIGASGLNTYVNANSGVSIFSINTANNTVTLHNLVTPTANTDAATKKYVDDSISSVTTTAAQIIRWTESA